MRKNASEKPIKKTEPSEKEILLAIKCEAPLLVKENFAPIEAATIKKEEEIEDASFLKIKLRSEGENIIPNVKKNILKETKAESPFGCWVRKNTPIVASIGASFAVVLASTSALLATRPWEEKNKSALVLLSISPSNGGKDESQANPYSLSYSFRVEKNGKVNPSSLKANNYSASIVKKASCFPTLYCQDDVAFATSLLKPAYAMGYLENSSEEEPNKLQITYFAPEAKSIEKKKKEYEAAFNKALKRAEKGIGVYASLNFVNGCEGLNLSYFKKLDSEKREQIIDAYSLFKTSNGKSLIEMDNYLQMDEKTLTSLSSTLSSTKETKLSPLALDALLHGTASAYYCSIDESHADNASLIETKKKEIIDEVESLTSLDEETKSSMKELLWKDAYYLTELTEQEEKALDSPFYSSYKEIRNLINNGLTEESYLTLLEEEKDIAESDATFLDFAPAIQGALLADSGDHAPASSASDASEEGGIISD